jgi:Flp pilus assembly pilin Flp
MSNSNLSKRLAGRRNQRGQGMTEYVIIVALVAIGAIGIYTFFGGVVRNQTSAMACGLAGNGCVTAESTNATNDATNGATAASAKQGLNNFGTNSTQQN